MGTYGGGGAEMPTHRKVERKKMDRQNGSENDIGRPALMELIGGDIAGC